VRQLEESKTKIENLLNWLSNVEEDSEGVWTKHTQPMEQNGTYLHEGDSKLGAGEEDEVNGNLLETDAEGHSEATKGNLNQQYEKVKVSYLNGEAGEAIRFRVEAWERVRLLYYTRLYKDFPYPSVTPNINYQLCS
jgi:hypothetical protein